MVLTDCVECDGLVSDAAAACPHCGHPAPASSNEIQPAQATATTTQAPAASGPIWRVFLWAIGFFVLGVLLNGLVEAAGIWASDDFIRSNVYRGSWVWLLVPYALASVGLFIGLARRHRGGPNPYRWLATALTIAVVAGIAVVLVAAASSEASAGDARAIAVDTTTTTTTVPTTSTTSPLDRRLYCLENYVSDISCDGEVPLSYLVFDHYWIERWRPLRNELIEANREQDEARMSITCELERDDLSAMTDRITSFEDASLREVSLAWFGEMERMLVACATGRWEAMVESDERVREYFRQACLRIAGCVPPRDPED